MVVSFLQWLISLAKYWCQQESFLEVKVFATLHPLYLVPGVQSLSHRLGHESYWKIDQKFWDVDLTTCKQSYNAKLFPNDLNFFFGIQLLTGRSALFLRQGILRHSFEKILSMFSCNSINTLDILYEQFSTRFKGQTDLGFVLLLSAFPALLSLGCAVWLGLYYLKDQKPKVVTNSGTFSWRFLFNFWKKKCAPYSARLILFSKLY